MGFIEWVQRRLIVHGFNPGTVDDAWGRKTRKATIQFQRAKGIPAEGVLNNATVELLRMPPAGVVAATAEPRRPRRRRIGICWIISRGWSWRSGSAACTRGGTMRS